MDALEAMSWDDLRHLEALDWLVSASGASRELGVSASTVYRRIATLEDALGVSCYVRGEGLTKAGRAFAALARRMRTELQGLRREVQDTRDEVEGRILITTLDGFVPLLLPAVASLSRRFAKLRIDIDVSNHGLSLRRGEADIGLTALASPGTQLIGRRLFPIEFGVFGTGRHVEDPEAAPWVVLGAPLDRSPIGAWERAVTENKRVAAATPSRRMLDDLVIAGVGIGAIPRRLAAMHPTLVEIEAYAERAAQLTTPAWLLTHPRNRDEARVTAVMRELAETLG
ncbi:MAG: LysR family transcriptional regulator [Myxococcota bacterium]